MQKSGRNRVEGAEMANSDHLVPVARHRRSKGLPDRRFAAQSYQPIVRDAGFPGQLRQPVSGDAAAAVAARAAGRADSWCAHQLRGELLDAAHDAQAGLRSGNQADREARSGGDGFHHRSRQHQGAHAAAHRAQRAADSGFGGVERSLRRHAVVPSGRAQPAQRARGRVDGDARGIYRATPATRA